MQEIAFIEVTRPLWHGGTQAALVAFAAGAVLGGALPWGVALVAVPALWLAAAWVADRLQPRR